MGSLNLMYIENYTYFIKFILNIFSRSILGIIGGSDTDEGAKKKARTGPGARNLSVMFYHYFSKDVPCDLCPNNISQ